MALRKLVGLNVKCGIYEIAPEGATELLERPGAKNRPVRGATVNRYARRMTAGVWTLSGEPIILNEAGELLDGEHRLRACIEAGKAFQSVVLFGDFQFRSMGQAAVRSGGDAIVLGLPDQENAIAVSAIAGLCIKHERAMRREASMYTNAHKSKEMWTDIDNAERLLWAKKNRRAGELYAMARTASGRGKSLVPLSAVAAAWYLAEQEVPAAAAAEFFEGLITGAGLSKDDVRLHLRSALSNKAQEGHRLGGVEAFHWIAKAWSLRGSRGRRLFAVKRSEAFPFIRPALVAVKAP